MTELKPGIKGLISKEVEILQEKYGKNELTAEKHDCFFKRAIHTIFEPMFLLLIVSAVIYFILGEPKDGTIMLVFVIAMIGIDIVQQWKTDKTLNALKDLSAPKISVIRDGKVRQILSSDLVPGDIMLLSEGIKIPADGKIIKSSDLCVDESTLTGEAEGVWKISKGETVPSNNYWRKDYCYAGTLVMQGSAYVRVKNIGIKTEYGKIGKNIANAPKIKTPLKKQTAGLVKHCSVIAAVLFILVSVITYFNLPDHSFTDRIIESILSGITLAMAMIPEEFPVVFTVFLSMGAWRIAKRHSLVRNLGSVETLGAVSVLCVDKTGTITENRMTVSDIWSKDGNTEHLCNIMGLACEVDTYDPMEKAMLAYCEKLGIKRENLLGDKLIKEYSFNNKLKMMGHVWKHNDTITIAAKGCPEKILTLCRLSSEELKLIETIISEMSRKGLRVIAIGERKLKSETEVPQNILDCNLSFCGVVGLSDPPRKAVKDDIKKCVRAGIRVIMITGDSSITAQSIADKVEIPNSVDVICGDELETMNDRELREKVKNASVFSRVIPEHKMRIVKALKENGEIVAMTGDGVNDAPALKYADIGIAMGKRGSEVSREAADLILLNDNFSTIVDTIRNGRRIYDNIRKAVGYIFTIHIPIALASLLAPLLRIPPASLLLLPAHVVIMELIIDPTCSIVLERQPEEKNIMERCPRSPKEKIITNKGIVKSIFQGIIIFIASFGSYYFMLYQSCSSELARTMGLVILMLSNLFLVLENSSDYEFIIKSSKRLIKDKVIKLVCAAAFFGLIMILYTPLCKTLKLTPLKLTELITAVLISAVSVMWYELVKLKYKIKVRKYNIKRQSTNLDTLSLN